MQPVELVRRLASLIPPRRRHLITYYGLAASHAKRRAQLMALVPAHDHAECGHSLPSPSAPLSPSPSPAATNPHRHSRVPWSHLLRPVFGIDVLQCPRCPGRMTVLAFLTDPAPVAAILTHLGLPTTAPPIAPARSRGPPEPDLVPLDQDPAWDADPPWEVE